MIPMQDTRKSISLTSTKCRQNFFGFGARGLQPPSPSSLLYLRPSEPDFTLNIEAPLPSQHSAR